MFQFALQILCVNTFAERKVTHGMKKSISLLLAVTLCLTLLCSCGGSSGGATGLRNVKWGMTRSEVRKLEQAEFVGADEAYLRFYDEDTDQPIVFLGESTHNKVDLWYYFNSEDTLYKIEYRLSNKQLTDNSYTHVKELMKDLYGNPYNEDAVDPEDENTRSSSWKNAKSDITLTYHGGAEGKTHTMYVTFLPNN